MAGPRAPTAAVVGAACVQADLAAGALVEADLAAGDSADKQATAKTETGSGE